MFAKEFRSTEVMRLPIKSRWFRLSVMLLNMSSRMWVILLRLSVRRSRTGNMPPRASRLGGRSSNRLPDR